jgi:hypothetical protein
MTDNPEPERVSLTIQPMRGNYTATPMQRLRRICKAMARAYGWKIVGITTQPGTHDSPQVKPEIKP